MHRPSPTADGRFRSSQVLKLPRELLVGSSPIPVYHRLETQLHNLIDKGLLRPDEQLPAEDEIAAHLHVSRLTVRNALRRLEQDLLIRREQGRGTFINPTC